ncbi:hypothetical protein [Clostridium sp. B9]
MSKKKTLKGMQDSMKKHNDDSSNSKNGFNDRSNSGKEPGIVNRKGL